MLLGIALNAVVDIMVIVGSIIIVKTITVFNNEKLPVTGVTFLIMPAIKPWPNIPITIEGTAANISTTTWSTCPNLLGAILTINTPVNIPIGVANNKLKPTLNIVFMIK